MHILNRKAFGFGVSIVALAAAAGATATSASAGAFAVHEQSAYYQGMSFAGSGTGDTLSSMYWNSAAAAAAPGINSETHISIVDADTDITATRGLLTLPPGAQLKSGDIADPIVVPASYANYQVNDRLYFGIALNSGFGAVTKPDNVDWVGSAIAITSDVFSINLNPTVAYKLTPELTVGVGVQIEYFDVRVNNTSRSAELDDVGFGVTAGVTWTPVAGTTIGVGYRSAVDFDLEGDFNVRAGPSFSARANLTLPDMVTIGLRQAITDRLDLLAGYEWTNWSRVGSIPVNGGPTGTLETLELNYEDGHFVSVGLEYDYSPSTTLRAGIAWEKSPINDLQRNVLLPDNDRFWVSAGLTHRFNERMSIDLAYSHIFVDDASICRQGATASPCTNATPLDDILVANSESSVDIISAAFRYKWGESEPELEPLK